MTKQWKFYDEDDNKIKDIQEKFNVGNLVANIIANRNVGTDEDIRIFLEPTREDFHDPFLFNDMEKAVNRIIQAIENKEKVLIYGDYDVDGITSTTVLKKYLEERGLNVEIYIPNRLFEGYGLNNKALDEIKQKGVNLIITVDCGISGVEEIAYANSLGIETIITDHHETGDVLPAAVAVVDAKRKDNTYPFRGLAGVGVVFKLIQAISITLKLEEKEYLKYLDFICVGTISDIVPLVNENRVIAKLGLKLLNQTRNVGLKELIKSIGFKEINSSAVSFGIAPRINACGRMGHQEEALELFLTNNIEEAKTITEKLNNYNSTRQEIERKIFNEALEKIQNEGNKSNTIVLAGENWHHGVIGIVSSKITEMFFKPSILICIEGEKGKGSGRSIPGFDLHDALTRCKDSLEKFGGHEMAVGLTLKADKFEEFKNKFEEIAIEEKTSEIVPIINVDGIITLKDLNRKTIEELKLLEPFGDSNKEPLFVYKNLKIDSIRALTEGKHLKLTLRDINYRINAIGFNLGYLVDEYRIGDKIDLVGTIEINSFNGIESIQLNIKDIMKSF